MRKAKRVNQKRKQVAREATSGLNAASRSVGEFNNGFREIADEMNEYSIRSLENVFRAWQQFLDAYVTEFSRLGDLYISLTRRASQPLRQVSRRSL
jgi:hypothetical protein